MERQKQAVARPAQRTCPAPPWLWASPRSLSQFHPVHQSGEKEESQGSAPGWGSQTTDRSQSNCFMLHCTWPTVYIRTPWLQTSRAADTWLEWLTVNFQSSSLRLSSQPHYLSWHDGPGPCLAILPVLCKKISIYRWHDADFWFFFYRFVNLSVNHSVSKGYKGRDIYSERTRARSSCEILGHFMVE